MFLRPVPWKAGDPVTAHIIPGIAVRSKGIGLQTTEDLGIQIMDRTGGMIYMEQEAFLEFLRIIPLVVSNMYE